MATQPLIFDGTHLGSAANISYNDVQFTEVLKSHVRAVPEYNKQKTTIKWIEYTIEVVAIVSPQSFNVSNTNGRTTTDRVMDVLRDRLLEPKRRLSYNDKGFGHFLIFQFSGSSPANNFTKVDIDFGPKPQLLVFEPLAGSGAAKIHWVATTRVTECTGFDYQNLITEFWVKSQLKINRSGYQVLTRTGYMEGAGTGFGIIGTDQSEQLTSSPTGSRSPNFLDKLLDTQSMQGYHLEQEYNLTDDLKGINFTLTYTEIESPNAFPEGVVDIQCSHNTSSKLKTDGFRRWFNRMDCAITLRPRLARGVAWAIFILIVIERIEQNVEYPTDSDIEGGNTSTIKVPIITDMEFTEHLFNHSAEFSISWISYANSIQEAFIETGIFHPLTNTNIHWSNWTEDIREFCQNSFGAYALTDHGNTHIIVDPCNQFIQNRFPDTTREFSEFHPFELFNVEKPIDEASWLDYQSKFRIKSKKKDVSHIRYRSLEEIKRGEFDEDVYSTFFKLAEPLNKNLRPQDYKIQDTGTDVTEITITGHAVRIGNPTKPPEIKMVDGRAVRLIDSDVQNEKLSSSSTPIHMTMWNLTYEVLGSITGDLITELESSNDQGHYI